MRITQIMLAKGFGGAERLFVDLCLALAEAGQDLQAICQSGSQSAEILRHHDKIKLKTINVLGAWDLLAVREISRLLKENRTDIAQAHLARAALLTGKACRKLHVPVVVTTHNYIDVKYYRYVDMLVPPTKDQYAYYQNKGVPTERLKLIRHFSPLLAERKVIDTKPQKLSLLTLGRLVEKKGFDVLLRAFARLDRHTGLEYELTIAGSGPQQQNLLALVDSLGLNDSVKLCGWVEDVHSFLSKGDIFVLPSLDEPFGIVVLEAMALGLPIVSTETQGPKEILDAEVAWLAKAGDDEALAKALQAACNDHEGRQRKSENGSRRFQENYSREAIIPEFMRLFDSLLATR